MPNFDPQLQKSVSLQDIDSIFKVPPPVKGQFNSSWPRKRRLKDAKTLAKRLIGSNAPLRAKLKYNVENGNCVSGTFSYGEFSRDYPMQDCSTYYDLESQGWIDWMKDRLSQPDSVFTNSKPLTHSTMSKSLITRINEALEGQESPVFKKPAPLRIGPVKPLPDINVDPKPWEELELRVDRAIKQDPSWSKLVWGVQAGADNTLALVCDDNTEEGWIVRKEDIKDPLVFPETRYSLV